MSYHQGDCHELPISHSVENGALGVSCWGNPLEVYRDKISEELYELESMSKTEKIIIRRVLEKAGISSY